jgi:hypothetical protein
MQATPGQRPVARAIPSQQFFNEGGGHGGDYTYTAIRPFTEYAIRDVQYRIAYCVFRNERNWADSPVDNRRISGDNPVEMGIKVWKFSAVLWITGEEFLPLHES